jgi:uncharacterized membrane protein YedE/YeeE
MFCNSNALMLLLLLGIVVVGYCPSPNFWLGQKKSPCVITLVFGFMGRVPLHPQIVPLYPNARQSLFGRDPS